MMVAVAVATVVKMAGCKKAEKNENLVDCICKYNYRGMKAGEEGTGTKCSLILQVKRLS